MSSFNQGFESGATAADSVLSFVGEVGQAIFDNIMNTVGTISGFFAGAYESATVYSAFGTVMVILVAMLFPIALGAVKHLANKNAVMPNNCGKVRNVAREEYLREQGWGRQNGKVSASNEWGVMV